MATKKLFRTRQGLLGGVLEGFAEYFEQDVTWWRLSFIVLLILTGVMPGVLFYILAWIVMPPKEDEPTQVEYTVYE